MTGKLNSLFNSPSLGYALHRLVVDDTGVPCDFEFLQVNATFERITGLKSEYLIGRNARQVIPDLEHARLDRIGCYGAVALDGSERVLEHYCEHLGRWFRVHVNSSEGLLFSTTYIDITEQKRTAAVLGNIADASFSLDAQWRFTEVSAGAEATPLGRPAAGLLGQVIWQLYPTLVSTNLHQDILDAAESCSFRRLESLSPLDNRHYEVFVNGRPGGVDVFMRDITDRKRVEQLRKLQAMYLETIIENQPGLVWLKDTESRFLAVNTAFAVSCRRDAPSAVAGLCDLDIWPKELAEKYRTDDAEVMASGAPKIVEELIADQGEERWFETFKSPVRDDNRAVIGTTGYARDITERKRAEEQLRQREQQLRESLNQVELFRTLVESSGDSFYIVDLDDGCRMRYVNEAALRHFRAPRDQVSSWRVPDWDPNYTLDTLPQLIASVERAQQLHLESQHRIADGTIVPVEITVNYMRSQDGHRLAYGWFSDITARLAAAAELRTAKLQAEAASRAKSEFLANMSHEIRTPLNGVIGFTDLLRRTPLTATQQQYVDNANLSGHTLLAIVNDILDFSKIEAGMMTLEALRTDLVELLATSVDIIKLSAATKNLEVLLDIDRNVPRFAMVDPLRLKQILANLLGNAVKFTVRGEVELKANYEQLEGKRGRFRISVRDTGIGVSEGKQEKLFKAFSQADSSTTREFGGTGLGLVISEMIAQKMGSRIQFSSAPGTGTTFYFDLITEAEHGLENSAAAIRAIGRCLVIDDNARSRQILERMLDQWGIATESCESGLAALRLLETSEPFNVVICDNHMPELDGLETIRLIRERQGTAASELPVILLQSPPDDGELQSRCADLGVRHRLTKPVRREALFACLSHIHARPEAIVQAGSADAAAAKKETAKQQQVATTCCKILVAEDVSTNMMLIVGLIRIMHPAAQVLEASNGAAAVEQYQAERPDLILMDVQMPVMDGLQATSAIRALEADGDSHVRIVALTAGAFNEERERCIAAGMDEFITKPLTPERVKEVLDQTHASKGRQP